MWLVQAIPIAKGIKAHSLSYFSSEKIDCGALIEVPLRKKNVPAIVVGVEDASISKAKLKSSDFALKKIATKGARLVFLTAYIRAAEDASLYFATSLGAVLHQTIPKVLLENAADLPKLTEEPGSEEPLTSTEVLAFQANRETRINDYKSIVRESFARRHSLYIMTPTIRAAESIGDSLSKGIEKYVFVLHSQLTKKELLKRVKSILSSEHPVLIVGTGGYLSVPRADIDTIIVERENAKSYKMQSRPYVDYRTFARFYARTLGARVVYADMPLSVETAWKVKQGEYDELGSNRTRLSTSADQYIVDMKPEKGSKEFFTLSTNILETIKSTEKTQKRTFLFNVRRGIAPTTVCEECGAVVTCKLCNASVVLHSSQGGNVFVCHSCGDARSAKERCATCNSWKLKALGIGAHRVKEELSKHIDESRIFTIDADSTKTYSQALKEAEAFYKKPGAVLIGTELALSFLNEPIAHSAVVSLDSLLSLPDPKMYEIVFSLVLRVRDLATTSFTLQTRQPELPLLREALEGNVTKFYEGEILNRKRFEYPPFTTLIKVSSMGSVQHITEEMEHLEEVFKGYPFYIYPAFNRIGNNKFVLHGLLKIKYGEWPNERLLSILKKLPPNISVNVGPESTL